ncbi:MAG: Si-specific NAD(P)(+) transhydrogenase [bacterium]|nr:Si-specific NAD(P)(+) transhydrogenase [bacterium]
MSNIKKNVQVIDVDVAVIGSGPGGQRAAVQSAKKNKKTLIIDRRIQKVGGVSLHTGTIPSKTLREAVIYLRGLRRRKVYGPSRRFDGEVTLKDLMDRVYAIWEHEISVIESQLKRNGVQVVYGQASFIDNHTLSVENKEKEEIARIHADKIIIATGTVPRHPEDVPFDHKVIFDSNFIFSHKSKIKQLPRSLIVCGAGIIGSEYAAMFGALGRSVHLVDDYQQMFPFIDKEILKLLQTNMAAMNVTFLLGQKRKKIEVTPEGKGRLITTDGTILEADAILFSKGRLPCVDPLKLENTRVRLTERRTIKVNECYQTGEENIFACGDVIGFPALASTSAEQGRVAARYAIGTEVTHHKPELFPLAIYTIPEISAIGKTEEELIKENVPYEKGFANYSEIAKAAIAGDDVGALKLLFHRNTREILGVHLIGDQASELVHIGQIVMTFKEKLDYFIKNVFNYPTWAEAYKVAALDGLNAVPDAEIR